MTTPAQPERRLLAAGLKKAAPWGTAIALESTDGILIETDGGLSRKQPNVPAKEADTPFGMESDLGPIDPVNFNPTFWTRYDPGALGVALALLFGTAGTPLAQFTVTNSNKYINFDEGGAELTGTVATGTYTGAALATAIAAALNGAPGKALTYTCTYSAVTRKFTIGAGSNFTIRWNTGTNKAADISTLCGYSDAADDTGAASYVSDSAVGLAYKHTFQWADTVYGNFVTFVAERAGKIFEVASAKVMGLDLVAADGFIKGTLQFRGDTVINTSVLNTATEVDVLAYADRGNRVKFKQGSVKINAESVGDVASETALECSDISVSCKRGFDNPHKLGAAPIIEPVENDHPIIQIKLKFPRMNATNAAFFQTFTAETEQKLLLKFEGETIESPHQYTLALFFPRLRIVDIDYPLDAVVPASMTLQAEEAAAEPTGMLYHRPYIEMINLKQTDYLA